MPSHGINLRSFLLQADVMRTYNFRGIGRRIRQASSSRRPQRYRLIARAASECIPALPDKVRAFELLASYSARRKLICSQRSESNFASGTTKSITAGINNNFYDDEDDHNQVKPGSAGMFVGWSEPHRCW